MKLIEQKLRLSASDITNHLACKHLSNLNIDVAQQRVSPPDYYDPLLQVLQQRGIEHENDYVEHLKKEGKQVVDLYTQDEEKLASASEKTRQAM